VKRPDASRPYANGAGSLIGDLLAHAHARALSGFGPQTLPTLGSIAAVMPAIRGPERPAVASCQPLPVSHDCRGIQIGDAVFPGEEIIHRFVPFAGV